MIRGNMTREEIESVSTAGAGIIRDGDTQTVVVLGDIPMRVPKNDISVVPSLRHYGFWESWITAWLTANCGTRDVFVDIGSNVGYFSVVAAELGARVWAFEANPSLARLLMKTTAFNDFYINTFPYAISDRAEELTLYVPGEYQGSASITADFDGQYTTTKIHTSAVRLDDLKVFELNPPTLIKMDIEGAEEKAWDGMENLLARHKPVVVLEYTSGRYSDKFPEKLANYGNLSKINHAGEEEFLFPEQLESFPEFEMVVVRPNV